MAIDPQVGLRNGKGRIHELGGVSKGEDSGKEKLTWEKWARMASRSS